MATLATALLKPEEGSPDSSEELPKVLRGLDQQLDKTGNEASGSDRFPYQNTDTQGGTPSSTPNKGNDTPQTSKTLGVSSDRFYRWHDYTHRGLDWIANVPLPESELDPTFRNEETLSELIFSDEESLAALAAYPPEQQAWGYRYEPSYMRRADELSFMKDTLLKETGMAWAIPEDGRSSLSLSLRGLGLENPEEAQRERTSSTFNLQKSGVLFHGSNRWSSCDSEKPEVRAEILRKLRYLGRFDKQLHESKGRCFAITDYDPWNSEKLTYRLGNLIEGRRAFSADHHWGNLTWDSQQFDVIAQVDGSVPKRIFQPLPLCNTPQFRDNEDHSLRHQMPLMFTAPWRRLIYLQGLASMPLTDAGEVGIQGCPYIDDRTDWDPHKQDCMRRDPQRMGLSEAVRIHLSCERASGNGFTNPYKDPYPFHVTFFEKIEGDMTTLEGSHWKIGELFEERFTNGEASQHFRQSAFTMVALSMPSYHHDQWVYQRKQGLDPFYTILLLLPEGFQLEKGYGVEDYNRRILTQCTAFQAELSCIVSALAQIIERWSILDKYLGSMMVNDFMEPKQYAALLLDDNNFTRSRKYFWAIGCLNEFIVSIADNVKQWDMYYEARAKDFLDSDQNMADRLDAASIYAPGYIGQGSNSEQSRYIQDGETQLQNVTLMIQAGMAHREALANLLAEFERKLETVKSLRDGLFNASALVETRASTRLVENITLLTHVSIFYLPLGFCASLWSIPQIDSLETKIPFIATAIIVGALTYGIVFNINTMTNQISRPYHRKRGKLVQKMQEEKENGWWYMRGMRFQEFKLSSEHRVPSEWLILVYAIKRLIGIWQKPIEKFREKNSMKEEVMIEGEHEIVNEKDKARMGTSALSNEIGGSTPGLWSSLRGRRVEESDNSV